MSILTRVPGLGALLKGLEQRRLDHVSDHTLPWAWVDEGGMYHGSDGAWMYASLPLSLMSTERAADGADLDALLHDLATSLGKRQVHLISHAWEEPARVPTGTPEGLVGHLRQSLRMLVPARGLILGVQLVADLSGQDRGLRASVVATVDQALGERVPDFSAYDEDRDRVGAALARWNARPVHGADANHLEAWYALGSATDLEVIERDDAIYVGAHALVEAVAVRAFPEDGDARPRPLFSAGAAGATVVSVRGTLATRTDHRAGVLTDPTGTLTGTSIVIGRRSSSGAETLTEASEVLPGIEVKPLPLRQVPALEETLPCSQRRMNPHLNRVTGADLARAGFAEPTPAGDDRGFLLGLAAPDFAYPCYLNPAGEAGQVTVVVGDHGSGKTFLSQHIALQALLAGLPTVYLATDTDAGRALVAPGRLARLEDLPRGSLDPFLYLPPAAAADVVRAVLPQLLPDLSAAQAGSVDAALRRAVAINATGISTALSLVDDQAVAARLVRAASRNTLGRLLLPGAVGPATPVGFAGAVVDFGAVCGDLTSPETQAAQDLLTACAVASAGAGAVVVADGFDGALAGRCTTAVLGAALDQPAGLLVVTGIGGTEAVTAPLAQSAATRISLKTSAVPAAEAHLSWVGLEQTPGRVAWLADAGTRSEGSVVQVPARALVRDRWQRTTSLIVGPVPTATLAALTRGQLTSYLADATD